METAKAEQKGEELGVDRIKEMIPHREPFLMIERLADIVPGTSAIGIKVLTGQEDFFRGHFPERKLMPGVLIVETMAQTAAALVVYTLGAEAEGRLVYFMSLDKARFRKPVVPGDELRVKVVCIQNRGRVWKFNGEAMVKSTLVAEATFTAMVVED
ncbi:MAG TPA: 3-hydroxyacyl-ACP dehydratase FabZ [Stellaceae bacterium]